MNKKLIFNAFAFKEGCQTSPQISKKTKQEDITSMYIKNIFVSLVSAKNKNPTCDVALITNLDLEEKTQGIFEKEGIIIYKVPFETFLFPVKFGWALAYYKLCALDFVCNKLPYSHIMMVDADTYSADSIEDLWAEMEKAPRGILLYDLQRRYMDKDLILVRNIFQCLYNRENSGLHLVGGEFVCARTGALKDFMNLVMECYERIKKVDFEIDTMLGDELLLSIAAGESKDVSYHGGAYIRRFWTYSGFYAADASWKYNAVSIWHCLNEKKTGFIKIYNYYQRKGTFPCKEMAAFLLGLPGCKKSITQKIYSKI